MRDYWLTQYVLAAVGWGYTIVCIVAVALALWLPKGKKAKALSAAVVIGIASIVPFRGYEQYRKEQEAAEVYKARLAKAQALFDERCKTAGEKIYRTVEGVEGILLTELRPEKTSSSSQYDSDDQYGYNVGGEEYVRYYLAGGSDRVSRYHFVEAPLGTEMRRFTTPLTAADSYQYWTKGGGVVSIASTKVDGFSAKYSVEWKDISTAEDRDSWIAGGSLRITDRATGEVLAERVGYLLESGMGNTDGQRSPWAWARYYGQSCPTVKSHNRVFVERVLKPSKGEGK